MRVGVLGNRNFRLVWTASIISGLGSWMLVIAAPFQVFHLTGSTVATGLTLAIEALPAMLVGPFAGVLVDRWNRRTTMVAADVASAAGVALMLLGSSPDRISMIYLGLLVESLAAMFFRPAARAIVPAVVGTGPDLFSANALSGFAAGIVRLLGPVLGTLLLSVDGWVLVVGVDVASYLASAILVAGISVGRAGDPVEDEMREIRGLRGIPSQLRDGLRYLAGAPLLRGLLVTSWVYWTANAALTVLLVPFVVRRLGSPGQDIGYLIAALGVGYLIGPAVARPLIARLATRPVLTIAYTAVGACFLVLFNAPTLAIAMTAAACSGIPGAIVVIVTSERMQAVTPDVILGRVGAAFYASDGAAAVAGAFLGPALTAVTSLGAALNILSVVVLATAPVAAGMLRPG